MQPKRLSLAFAAAGLLAAGASAQATLTVEQVASGLDDPLWAGAPPGDDRIFVIEQVDADIEIFRDGAHVGKFLDLSAKVAGSGERGLLSMVFDPDYDTNGHFYVYYTFGGCSPFGSCGSSRIERYTVSANPDVADAASGVTVIEVAQPQSNHNGGNLQFGPDGMLYFAWGDGGGAGDSSCNAQKMDTLLGKMIRIDVSSLPYSVPADNPFVGVAGALPEIFHLGLRNPWRWFFDAETGDTWIADVGQNQWEEVNAVPAGASGLNFGWKIMEGLHCFGTSGCPGGIPACNDASLTDPIHEYSHSLGCSVTGGAVYRGCDLPDWEGTYFFADICSGTTWALEHDFGTGTTSPVQNLSSQIGPGAGVNSQTHIGYDGFGELLIVDQGGEVHRVRPGDSLSRDVASISVSAGGTQTFSLHAGDENAGDLYLLAGSLTGTGPFPIGLTVVPLTVDAYTIFGIANPNTPPLPDNFGTLDACGNAVAHLTVGPGAAPGSLIGATAWHAYVLLNGSFVPDFSSNAVTVSFTP